MRSLLECSDREVLEYFGAGVGPDTRREHQRQQECDDPRRSPPPVVEGEEG